VGTRIRPQLLDIKMTEPESYGFPNAQEIASNLYLAYHKYIERFLITNLEIIEGRVPSNEEVSRFAMKINYPDGSCEFRWRGQSIGKIPAPMKLFGLE